VKEAETPITHGDSLVLAEGAPTGAVKIRFELPMQNSAPRRPATSPVQRLQPAASANSTPNPCASPTLLAHAQPTLIARDAAATPVAKLAVRYADGKKETHNINAFPFEIGREPTGIDSHRTPESAAKVSRQHVRIDGAKGGGFAIRNLAEKANGCWAHGEKLSGRFTVATIPSQAENGWIVLGERDLSANSIAIRIEAIG
jgi:hypothetical protein